MSKTKEKSAANLSLLLTEEEAIVLEKIKVKLNESTGTKTVKRLFSIFFQNEERREEISNLKKEINRLKNELQKEQKNNERVRGKVAVFINAFQDLEEVINPE